MREQNKAKAQGLDIDPEIKAFHERTAKQPYTPLSKENRDAYEKDLVDYQKHLRENPERNKSQWKTAFEDEPRDEPMDSKEKYNEENHRDFSQVKERYHRKERENPNPKKDRFRYSG